MDPSALALSHAVVTAIDFAGTFAFAVSGATVGVRKGLDLFGVLVLAFAAATAGGIARDVLLGATPPVALQDLRYIAVSTGAGLVAFYRDAWVQRLRNPVQIWDAIGLGLFAVIGTSKALDHGLGPTGAILLGVLTGIGGGIVRDLLVMEIPAVLRRELYAVAALLGAALVVAGHALALPAIPVSLLAASACFALRYLAMRHDWQLPVARTRG